MNPEERTALENYVRAEVSRSIDQKMAADETIRAYVENVAHKVVEDSFDARFKPFYRNPTFTGARNFVIGGLALIGITSFWGDLVRQPLQQFIQLDQRLDKAVSQALTRRQYQVFLGGFQLGTSETLIADENDSCNSLRANYLKNDDIIVPKDSIQAFIPSCMRLNRSFVGADDLSFVAEPNEKIYIEILMMLRKAPSIENGFESGALSLRKLASALAKGGEIIGRDKIQDDLITVRVDKDVIKLTQSDNMISLRDSSSNDLDDYVFFWTWYQIPENTGQFHNLSISLPKAVDTEKYPNNLIIRVVIERNKANQAETDAAKK